jgi:DNA primase
MPVIQDVVARYTDLVPADRQHLRGRCPLCNAEDPELYVSPAKGVFHCFACQQSGDAIGFLMQIAGVDYPTALQLLDG